MRMYGLGLIALIMLGGSVAGSETEVPWFTGADMSSLEQVEAEGGMFRVHGKPIDPLRLLSVRGVDLMRLRLWHDPADAYADLGSVVDLAVRARDHGLDVLLDLHFSDTWADPGHQSPPSAWSGAPFPALLDSVRLHARTAVAALRTAGALPSIVQLGNEITNGMLWDVGRVGGPFDTDAQWTKLAALLAAAREGVAEGAAPDPSPRTMVHLDCGGDPDAAMWFLDGLDDAGYSPDMVGLSYYPWWHGDLGDLAATLAAVAHRLGRPVMVVETAYPWTLDWSDPTHNPVGMPSQLLGGFEATPAGQARFLAEVIDIVRATPDGLGAGVVYWEPGWLPTGTSSWENLGLWDVEGEELPGLGVLGEQASPAGDPPRAFRQLGDDHR